MTGIGRFTGKLGGTLTAAIGAALVLPAGAEAVDVQITVQNVGPANGTYFGPTWFGFHDGTFDYFNSGAAASSALQTLAEDGPPSQVDAMFAASGAGSASGVVVGTGSTFSPQFDPGESQSIMLSLDAMNPKSRYVSFGSMVVPSNDAFMGNDNPMGIQIFDGSGNFVGADFIVMGSMIWDAGTEMNDEVPMNTGFFGQMTPNTGPDENGVVMFHPGYNPVGSGGILDSAMFASADFKQAGFQVARIIITPEPASMALLGLGGVLFARRRRRTA